MIICHSRKFIFVHLHKCAGTSLTDALRPFLSDGDLTICGRDDPSQSSGELATSTSELRKHSTALQISRAVGEETWSSYFKFAFVRHPLDRLVSLYEFFNRVHGNVTSSESAMRAGLFSRKHRQPKYPEQPPWTWAGMKAFLGTNDFSGFIRSDDLAKAQGAMPQTRSLTDRSGKLIVDFVGKVENIVDDWRKLCDQLGIETSQISHTNQSQRRFDDLLRYWNKEDLDFVREKYRADFELFSYSTDDVL